MSRARAPPPKKKKAATAKVSSKRSRSRGGGGIRISTLQKKYGFDVGTDVKVEKKTISPKIAVATKKKQKVKRASLAQRKALAKELRDKQDLLSSMFPEDLENLIRYLSLRRDPPPPPPPHGWGRGAMRTGGASADDDIYLVGGGAGYKPKPEPQPVLDVWCPQCRHQLSSEDVVSGFQSGRLDYRTTCPSCTHRFQTTFGFAANSHFRFVWLCQEQTLDQYEYWNLTRDQSDPSQDVADLLLKNRPEIFFNAYRYGSMDCEDVKQRVIEFLGIGVDGPMDEQEDGDDEEEEEDEDDDARVF